MGVGLVQSHELSWGLVIATYNRGDILEQAITLATGQSRRPAEIIIVDASKNWEETKQRLAIRVFARNPDIRWVYEKATQRSSAAQRNQGFSLSTADIIFFIDDDSLMYPGCAETILNIYEADGNGQIAGIQAELVGEPPKGSHITSARKETGYAPTLRLNTGHFSRLKHLMWQNVFLMDAKKLFIPYDADFPVFPIPITVASASIKPEHLLQGCRMTFRRDALLKEGFEPLLLSYSPGEDLDLSYRVSRHGCLLTAMDAYIHHAELADGRVRRLEATFLSATNQALFLRKNSPHLATSKSRYFKLMARRVLAELLKDLLSRRWSFPQLRGLLRAWQPAQHIFAMSDADLHRNYPALQAEILNGGRIGSSACKQIVPRR
jgi:GT2 family glycosyltransferase